MSERYQENSRHLPLGTLAEAQFEGSGLTGVIEGYGFDRKGHFFYLLRLAEGFWKDGKTNSGCFVSLLAVHENNLDPL